jgi:hypothetical protein
MRHTAPLPPDVHGDRRREWFVPKFGPERFRLFVGLLFLPYTGMVLAFTVIGATLAPVVHWDRVVALGIIYFLALGIGAHALDALGSKGPRPWGAAFERRTLLSLAVGSVAIAYAIGLYYIVAHAPWLGVIAVLEGFFLLAYNLEWFGGRFHTDGWFAFSWGALPVLAGYVMQTNALAPAALLVAAGVALLSLVEIKASRPYKALKRSAGEADPDRAAAHLRQFEAILKSVSLGVLLLALGLAVLRWGGW